MHSDFFGDNKDHGKGFVLGSLFEAMPEWNLRVDPMLSDGAWDESVDKDIINAYRRFLRLPERCPLINHTLRYTGLNKVVRHGNRESYFQPHLGQDNDIFFDADNGIGKGGRKHLPRPVLPYLLSEQSNRIVLVFQSRSRSKSFEVDFAKKASKSGLGYFLVFLGQDTFFVFLGRQSNPRVSALREVMRLALSPFDSRRIKP